MHDLVAISVILYYKYATYVIVLEFIRKEHIWPLLECSKYSSLIENKAYSLRLAQEILLSSFLCNLESSLVAEVADAPSMVATYIPHSNSKFTLSLDSLLRYGSPHLSIADLVTPSDIARDMNNTTLISSSKSFDCIFSVQSFSSIPNDRLILYFDSIANLLRPGGLAIHAIDFHISDVPSDHWKNRLSILTDLLTMNPDLEPIGSVYQGELAFSCEYASNPDNILFDLKKKSPSLNALRQSAQSVSIIWGARKI